MTKQWKRQLIETSFTWSELDQMSKQNIRYAGKVNFGLGTCEKYVRRETEMDKFRKNIKEMFRRALWRIQ